ncbi:MAG: helix-turn-helix domain-containing protein [Pseudoflavonifractor sp.]
MEKIDVTSKKTLREKILTYLSLLAQHKGSTYIEVPLGRVELADYLCADRSALTRELSNMKRDGLLDYDKNTFHLLK